MLTRSTAARSTIRTVGRRAFSSQEVSGVKVISRDDGRTTSQVSVIIKAGSRYNTTPGLAHILEKFAFKNTSNRSALRLTRETELLGGQLSTSLSRENIVLTAKFLREDLPYFVEALGDVLANTSFNKYELIEDVTPLVALEAQAAAQDAAFVSTEAAYSAAFHNGLGNSLLAESYSPVTIDQVKNFASSAFTKSNITVVGNSVVESDLAALVGKYFGGLSAGSALSSPATKAHSGEVRVKSSGANALTIAFPSTSVNPANSVIAHVLGGASNVKWSVGSSLLSHVANKTGTTINTSYSPYSDASLLSVTISGASALAVSDAAALATKEIKGLSASLSEEAIKKASAAVRFAAADLVDANPVAAVLAGDAAVSADAIAEAASALSSGPVAVGAVGQVHNLPYADELF
ncbi:hypothetical protein DV451_004018 [Geotrichum candidum]|uniref:Cytochrome b-c1 complex subunit 2, mitochondrial n=1 Tax=Geotrichum candidum TaxID=1173061 RepID=A0A9P5G1N9_GEOCN|nr:hypothetical protein DV451_004018 [Geotrichum candidum]